MPPLIASSTWETVTIPLSKFQEINKQNLSALDNLSLGFRYAWGSGASNSGAIYVDGFVFEP